MRVLVTGGRKYGATREERFLLFGTLDDFHTLNGISVIIEGGALGADRLAKTWADGTKGVQHEQYNADWDDLEAEVVVKRTRKDGSVYNAAAGAIRNKRMIVEGRPDIVFAFKGGSGTADMVAQAERAGIKVEKIGW